MATIDLEVPARTLTTVSDLAWLSTVREVRHPLSHRNPIWMRENAIRGGAPLPRPTVPYPERHPCCELTFSFEGRGIQYVGKERLEIQGGAVMLLGPNLPHTAELLEYPSRAITVHILPVLFLELGPKGDGAKILKRFSDPQSITSRITYPGRALRHFIESTLAEMLREFRSDGFGSELRLKALLTEILVALLRGEEEDGRGHPPGGGGPDWEQVRQALHYMHEHYADAVYVGEIARAVRTGERQLNRLFHEAIGMGCIEYLNAYRVAHAATLLSTSTTPVTTVAFAVGFETLSHFNTTFRNVMKMSPSEYSGARAAGSSSCGSRPRTPCCARL